MDVVIILFNKVMPVFLVIGAGFLYGKSRVLDTKSISEMVLAVIMPCFAMISVRKIPLASTNVLMSAIAPIVVCLGLFLCVFTFLRVTNGEKFRGLYLPAMFSNAGNIALPIALITYGEEAVASALIYMVVLGLLIFSLGIFIVSKEIGLTELLKQYVLYAIIFGFAINAFHIPIPNQINIALDMIGSMAIPMLLLTLGYNLNNFHIYSLKFAFAGSFIRIGMGFIISWIIFIKMLGLTNITGKTIVLLSSMPAAVMVYPIAEKYEANPDIVASVIVASTLISIVTIPLVICFLG